MPENRTSIRSRIRRKLLAWPDAVTTVGTQQTAAALTLVVVANTYLVERHILEIESEIERIVSIAGTTLTVYRGDHDTAAAVHTVGKTVTAWPWWGWPTAELNDLILSAFRFLHPEVWTPMYFENTILREKREFGLPAGIRRPDGDVVIGLELKDAAGHWRPVYNWIHEGDRVKLGFTMDQNREARMLVRKHHAELTDDATQIESNDIVDAVVQYACKEALEGLLANRTRYVEYSASLNDRASTPDELQRQIFYFANQAQLAKDRASRPGLAGFASTYRG